MTNAELLLDVIGEVDDEYILDVENRISMIRKRRKTTFSSLAAVFVVAFSVIIFTITSGYIPKLGNTASNEAAQESDQLVMTETYNTSDNFNKGGSYESDEEYSYGNSSLTDSQVGGGNHGITGIAIDDYFYFQVPEDGIYRYTVNSNCEKLVDTSESKEWYDLIANDNGLYITTGKDAIFRFSHDSNVSTTLIELPFKDIYIYTYSEKDILVKTEPGENQFVVDGITGDEKKDYLNTIPVKAKSDYKVFLISYDHDDTDTWWNYYIKRTDGTSSSAMRTHASTPQGDDKFLFNIDYEDNIVCYDVEESKETILLNEKDLSYKDLYSDSEYIYLCDYHGEHSAKELKSPPMCYKVIYNEQGKPCDLELIDDNIVE